MQTGFSIKELKTQNKMLILKLIATLGPISRVELAQKTNLTKMTVGNLVSELLAEDYICEISENNSFSETSNSLGRKPVLLSICDKSPCICGMLIKRGFCQVILSDLAGNILKETSREYNHTIDSDWLADTLLCLFHSLTDHFPRLILAIGISSIGPVNTKTGTILNPPFFFGIKNLNIVSIVEKATRLPVFLINDANAGALAEKLFGAQKDTSDFAYLHIMNGIGSGFILNNKLFEGVNGQSGEIGHTSINFKGPSCACGNTGCLELYANLEQIRKKIESLRTCFPDSPLHNSVPTNWNSLLKAAAAKDALALSVLEDFCDYISFALINTLNLLDLSTLVVGYDSVENYHIIEDILFQKLSRSIMAATYQTLHVIHSSFDGNAPLIGAIGIAAEHFFSLDPRILQVLNK